MNDASRVDVLHAPEDLVDEELDVVVRQLLRFDDVVEVGSHEVGHHITKIFKYMQWRREIKVSML